VPQRVLVTGAAGFIGQALCRRLERDGFIVRRSVREVPKEAGSSGTDVVVLHDASGGEAISAAMRDVDAVVHLAARVHVMKDTAADPLQEFRRVNCLWTERLIERAAAEGVRRFVYMSSVKVNGEWTTTPFTEADTPHPEDPYGLSKWEAEQIIARVSARSGIEAVIVRSPLVYGSGVGGNFLSLLKMIRRGIPLPLGAVRNKRSLVFRDNLVDALATCLRDPRATGQTYLVSDGEDLSTPDLIRRIGRAMGVSVRLWPVPVSLLRFFGALVGRQGVVGRLTDNLQIDASKLRRELGWSPPWSVDRGIEETVDWFVTTGG
jgi:nucleoside-diphosphate-sugar epimerase